MGKGLLKIMGMLGMVLAFGLMLGGCGEEFQTAKIKVTHAGSSNTAHVEIWDNSGIVAEGDAERGSNTSFSLDAGQYRVQVGSAKWPTDGSTTQMNGTINLTYTGSKIERN